MDMDYIYSPLNDADKEIRVLSLLPESRQTGIIHANLETYSLRAFTKEYQDFLSTECTGLSRRKAAILWAQEETKPQPGQSTRLRPVHATKPPSRYYRFQWGDYATLSYVWGDEHSTVAIVLNGKLKRVTSNLAKALRAFCEACEFEHSLKLWVDALSINQDDMSERAREIQRMREIYANSWAVVAWLGEGDYRSNLALGLVRDLASYGRMDCGKDLADRLRVEPYSLGRDSWLPLLEFMERPYWYRLWVIQEVIMGASATSIRCGDLSIDWRTFCSGLNFLHDYLWQVKDELLQREVLATRSPRTPIWTTSSLHLIRLDLSILGEREENGGEHLSFGRLLEISNSADCKDARDKVYALIGLMPDAVAQRLQPDYNLPVSKVYTLTARAFIEAYDDLEPIREGNPWGPTNVSSWAADWSWEGRVRHSRPETPLWGPPEFFPRPKYNESHHCPYNASRNSKHDAVFSGDGSELSCSGFIVDSISGLSAHGEGFFHWIESSISQPMQWTSIYGDHKSTVEALRKTFMADRVYGGERSDHRHSAIFYLPSTFSAGRQQFLKRGWSWLAEQEGYYFSWSHFRKANKHFQLGEYQFDNFFTDTIPEQASEYDLTESYCCFVRSSRRRRLMTTEKGYLGWAPDNIYGPEDMRTKPGDLIAVLFGCTTPIVIRQHGSKYQVIGEAYVQGLMDGEAMDLSKTGISHPQRFTFC